MKKKYTRGSNKDFYIKFNVKDFQTDTKVKDCSAEANGIYIHLLCVLFSCDYKGKMLIKGSCIDDLPDILLKQNVEQNNKQITEQIKNICFCIAAYFVKHLPFEKNEIERGLCELMQNDVVYISEGYLCQKRMIRDYEISMVRALAGKSGGKATQRRQKKEELLAEDLLKQNLKQKEQQNPNYNYNYNSNYIDKDKRGIGNTEGVQGSESLGEEGKDVKNEVPDHYVGNWHLETPTENCLNYFMSHAHFDADRNFCLELFWKQGIELPKEELADRLRAWGVKFNEITSGDHPERNMRGDNSWVQHFKNYMKKRNLSENPLKVVIAKKESTKTSKVMSGDAPIEEQQAYYQHRKRE